MNLPATVFWLCAGLVAYTFAVYPLLLALLARFRGRPVRRSESFTTTVSFVVAAHNEQGRIEARLRELASLLDASGLEGEVILVSDGSTDGTAEIARRFGPPVRVIEIGANVGKAAALSRGCAEARGEILAFADVRQRWMPEALRRLVANFADPAVGAVSGDLVIEAEPGITAGVGLYWRYEKAIRRLESRVHSVAGVTGAICAVRRTLFHPIPPGTILDDVYWPMRVVMRGFRVVHDESALAYDHLPARAQDEFRRKVRTLCGNYQLAARLPSLLLPWRNPICWQFDSHKLLRLVVPWALPALLVAPALLTGPVYRLAFGAQWVFYLAALAGSWRPIGRRFRLAATATSFVVLNAAAAMALWVWIRGHASRSWSKVTYETPSPPQPLVDDLDAFPDNHLPAPGSESAASSSRVGRT